MLANRGILIKIEKLYIKKKNIFSLLKQRDKENYKFL